ncbi:ankyrin [Dissoconium aciculare CBS 342.82]|jgi:ankyrin repeat protein|uniref:Ankyrin n=1 Tax=Dissoconium aciculare CBS 342.82 TaxID=1314786 RepID=A0A6J3M5R3_9PEZI|nr:ankyrin [Dissoconium aciculare CBS 342.82]KAF1822869.1 ankyrin [Dissoconium aciculare CBS 342.82]
MGLPQRTDPEEASEARQPDINPGPSSTRDASQLPPEALALATKLFDFARQGKAAELEQYISAGIPVNLTNHKGDTLLMLAAYHGYADTVRMLLDRGADPDVLNDRGQSPVAGAVFKGHDEVVRIMAEKGADLAAGQPNAIDSARMFNRTEYLRLFQVEDS